MNWLLLLADPVKPLAEAKALFERDYLRAALNKYGSQRATASAMGIGYSTLKTKLMMARRAA